MRAKCPEQRPRGWANGGRFTETNKTNPKTRKKEATQILLITKLRGANMMIFLKHLQKNTCRGKSNWLLPAAVIYHLLLQCLLGLALPSVWVCPRIQRPISFSLPSHLQLHLVSLHGYPTGQIQLMALATKP